MKKGMTILFAVMISAFSMAQEVKEKDIPVTVKTAFEKTYPDVKDVDWEMENGNYEAEFEIKDTDYSVLFDALGNILETEIEILINDLPLTVKDHVSKNYPGQKIKEAKKITEAKGTVKYEVTVKDKDLIFDSNGNFVKEAEDSND